jgi:hypothetical protein
MGKAPEWTLGFAFDAVGKGLVDHLKEIQKSATSTADALSEIQGSMPVSKGDADLKKFSKSVKTVRKVVEDFDQTREDLQRESESGDLISNMPETAPVSTAPIYMTAEQRRNFEDQIRDAAKLVKENTNKMEKSFRSFSSETVKNFDTIFESITKGTITSLPNFREIAAVLSEMPKLALKIRTRFDSLAKSQKTTQRDVIWAMDYYQGSIKEALGSQDSLNSLGKISAQMFGKVAESIVPVSRELDLVVGAAGLIASALEKPYAFIKNKLSGTVAGLKESLLGIFKKKPSPPVDQKKKPVENIPEMELTPLDTDAAEASAKQVSDKLAASASASVTEIFDQTGKEIETSIKSSLSQMDLSEEIRRKLENEFRQGMAQLDTLGRETVEKYLAGISAALTGQAFSGQISASIENALGKGSAGLQEAGRTTAAKFIIGIRDFLNATSLSKEVEGVFSRAVPTNLMPNTERIKEALESIGSNYDSLKTTISQSCTSASYSMTGLCDATVSAFDQMGKSKEAFLNNMSKAAEQIPANAKKISEALQKSKNQGFGDDLLPKLEALDTKFKNLQERIKRLMDSGSSPAGKLSEGTVAQMGGSVGSIKDALARSSMPTSSLPSIREKEGAEMGAVVQRLDTLMGGFSNMIRAIQDGQRDVKVGVNLKAEPNTSRIFRLLTASGKDITGAEGNAK